MGSGDADEIRAYARLPGLDVAVLHRGAQGGGDGEQIMIALRAVPSFAALGRPAGFADPLLLWMRLGQAMWAASWLGCLAAVGAPPPWLARDD